ncbi:hypothetical protein D3C83_218510 [compost metagenome]
MSPTKTPIVDISTPVMMMAGFTTELNWLMRISEISMTAIMNAPWRNSAASVCSSD